MIYRQKTRGQLMKLPAVLVVLHILAITSFVAPSCSSAASIDQSSGLSYVCSAGGTLQLCASGNMIHVGVPVLPDIDWNSGALEKFAVLNLEVFDSLGNQLFLGIPRTIRFPTVLPAGRRYLFSLPIPSQATQAIPLGQTTLLEVWIYTSGPRFDTGDAQQYFIGINEPPITRSHNLVPPNRR
jgi:hypothetical protein